MSAATIVNLTAGLNHRCPQHLCERFGHANGLRLTMFSPKPTSIYSAITLAPSSGRFRHGTTVKCKHGLAPIFSFVKVSLKNRSTAPFQPIPLHAAPQLHRTYAVVDNQRPLWPSLSSRECDDVAFRGH
jgi:hypothetical protein